MTSDARAGLVRREPFRLFFPLAALLGLAGVLPWLLFGSGLSTAWPGTYHALTMTQGFVVATAAGFLGTMIPRRTGGAPFARGELGLVIAGLTVLPPALALGRLAIAECASLVVLATLAQFAVRRLRASRGPRAAPASFVLLPSGLAMGATGSGLLLASALGAPAWTLALGRGLVEEGLVLGLVLALAPMLTGIIAHDRPPADRPARGARLLHVTAALLLAASFGVQLRSTGAGVLVRGAVVLAELVLAAGIWRPATVPGLHRRVFLLALWLVPLGLILGGLRPAMRVPFLHLTLVGGVSLLIFAVALHVSFLHTGRESLARRSPWPVAAVAVLTVAAALARASAERWFSADFVTVLLIAASLWSLAAIVWMLYVVPMLWWQPKP